MAQKDPNAVGGPKRLSILDGLITGLFGPSTAEMTPEEGAKVERERASAASGVAAAADSARKNPGAEYMNGPSVGGSGDLISAIGSLFKLFQ